MHAVNKIVSEVSTGCVRLACFFSCAFLRLSGKLVVYLWHKHRIRKDIESAYARSVVSITFPEAGRLIVVDGPRRHQLNLSGILIPLIAQQAAERIIAHWIMQGPYRLLALSSGDDLIRGRESLIDALVSAGLAQAKPGRSGAIYQEAITLAKMRNSAKASYAA
jgi:hypothetical protein